MLFTTKEISDLLRVSEETVRRWIRNGDLKATQEGKSYFVKGDDLMDAIKKKAEDSTTSIGKIVNAQLSGFAKAIASSKDDFSEAIKKLKEETTKHFQEQTGNNETFTTSIKHYSDDLFNKIANEIKTYKSDKSSKNTPVTAAEIDNYIEDLKLKKRRIELDFQTQLLEIDEQIATYQKLKDSIENEDTPEEVKDPFIDNPTEKVNLEKDITDEDM